MTIKRTNMIRHACVTATVVVVWACIKTTAYCQVDCDREPIQYTESEVNDPIAQLQERINSGDIKLNFEERRWYLRSILDELKITEKSQTLVFSKTSFQQRLITPRAPRALYFNDDVYIGFVQRGDVLEFSSVDPQQGAIFYTLKQEEVEKPTFIRDRGNCLTCHASSRTQNVPGHLVRSVYPSQSGLPHFGAGTFRTNHASPMEERWGGWYVTGTHGKQRHMGNVVSKDRDRPDLLDVESGANVRDLSDLLSTRAYLSEHSDIVALMVLEHQTDMHNLITHANYSARTALYQSESMNKVLERPAGHISESTQRRIDNAAEKLVRYMLFVDEIELTDPIEGTSGFALEFAAQGKKDSRGRSLREFNLKTRMFKYPCSYLIYSDAFDAMPEVTKTYVYRRLWEVLTGKETDEAFSRLTEDDRQSILEILKETKQDLPDYWQANT